MQIKYSIECSHTDKHLIIKADESFYTLIGYEKEEFYELFKNSFLSIVYQEDLMRYTNEFNNVKENYSIQYRIITSDNTIKYMEETGYCYKDNNNQCVCHGEITEITAWVNNKYKSDYAINIYENEKYTFEFNVANNTLFLNENTAKVFGTTTICYNFPYCIFEEDIVYKDDIKKFCDIFSNYANGSNTFGTEIRMRINGKYIWLMCITKGIYDKKNKLVKIIGFLQNIDDEKIIKNNTLINTNLCNPENIKPIVEEYITTINKNGALLVFDIDDFEKIANQMQKIHINQIIARVCNTISQCFEENILISQVGESNFLVFVYDVRSSIKIRETADKIREKINKECSTEQLNVTVSIGISFYPKNGNNFTELLSKSNTALTYAKHNGKNTTIVFMEKLHSILNLISGNKKNNNLIDSKVLYIEDLPQYVSNEYEKTENIDKKTEEIFDVIGNHIDVDRISLFYIDKEKTAIVNKTFWSNTEKDIILKNVKYPYDKFPLKDIIFDDTSLFLYNSSEYYKESISKWFEKRETISAFVYGFKQKSETIAYLVFEKTNERLDYTGYFEEIKRCSQTIMLYELLNNKKKNISIYESLANVVTAHSESMVYCIDEKTFNIKYISEEFALSFPNIKVGKPCYKQIRGYDNPCEDCPATKINTKIDSTSISEMHLEKLGSWYDLCATKIENSFNNVYVISMYDTSDFHNFRNETKLEIYDFGREFLGHLYTECTAENLSPFLSPDVILTNNEGNILASSINNCVYFFNVLFKQVGSDLADNLKQEYRIKNKFVNIQNRKESSLYLTVEVHYNDGKTRGKYDIKFIIYINRINNVYKIEKINIAYHDLCDLYNKFDDEDFDEEIQKHINTLKSIYCDMMIGFTFSEKQSIYYISDCLTEFLGYDSKEEFLKTNSNFLDIVENQDKFDFTYNVDKLKEKAKNFSTEIRIYDKHGNKIWVKIYCQSFVNSNNKKVAMCLLTDIDKQKELEDQLKLYKDSTLNGAVILTFTSELNILYANDVFYNMFGYTKESFKSKYNNQCKNVLNSEDHKRIKQSMLDATAIGKTSMEYTGRIRCADGSEKIAKATLTLQNHNGTKVISGLVFDVTEKELLISKIEKNEERYRLALNQTNLCIWEYDIINKRIHSSKSALEKHGFNFDLENVPDFLLLTGYIHSDDMENFKAMYKKLDQGVPRVTGEFRLQKNDNSGWWWEKTTYTTIFSDDGKPIRAIALGEDITEQKNAEIRYQMAIQAKNILTKGTLLSFNVDLTKDTIDSLEKADNIVTNIQSSHTYTEVYEKWNETIENNEDKKRFLTLFCKNSLIAAYNTGNDYAFLEYRRKYNNGEVKWVKLAVQMIKDAVTGDLCGYFSVRDIHEKKILELSLRSRAEKDTLTGTYNKETCTIMMQDNLDKNYKEDKKTAFVIFNIDYFSKIVKQYGYNVSDNVIKRLAEILTQKLGAKAIVGRNYGDEFIALITGFKKESTVKAVVDEIREYVKTPYAFKGIKESVSISVGVVFSTIQRENVNTLFEQAKIALELAKTNGKNQCVIYSGEKRTLPLSMSSSGNQMISTEDFQNQLLLKCSYTVLTLISLNGIMKEVLTVLNEFYGATGTSAVEYDYFNQKCISAYNNISGKFTLNNTKKQYYTENYEHLEKHFITQKTYYIDDMLKVKADNESIYNSLRENDINKFIVAPCLDSGKIIALIKVDNPSKNTDCLSFIANIAKMLEYRLSYKQVKKYQNILMNYDKLTGLYNRNTYYKYCSVLNVDSLITLGVLSIDINGLEKINRIYGMQQGDIVLKSTAKAITQIFDNCDCFALTGGLFTVICKNITKDSFNEKVELLRIKQRDVFDNVFALGYAWADFDIQVEKLTEQAEEIMNIEKQNYYSKCDRELKFDNGYKEKLLEEINKNHFVMYLQPKAQISNNKVIAAEALVRYKKEDGTIIYPDKFIPKIEKSGLLKYIDLFIFEQVCRLIQKWIDNGIEPIVISLNFSRRTILDNTILETVDEIYSKYKIPKKYLEIEVTESMGDVEKDTLLSVCRKITENGYRVSIDDFGAKYSNLSIMSTMPLSAVKFDRSLVNDLYSNYKARVLLGSFIDTCKKLNIESVAEGVETIEQLDILKELNCDFAQGYYFNKPIPVEDFEHLYIDNQ